VVFCNEAIGERDCRNPDDDKFIAAAVAAGADFVLTGDKILQRSASTAASESSNRRHS